MTWLKVSLVAVLALALPIFLFVNSRVPQATEHSQFVDSLRRLKEQDALTTQEILELRFSLLTNYDPLVATSLAVTQTAASLPAQAQLLYPMGNASTLASELSPYLKTLAQKQQCIEDFKSKNAMLKNSLAYLPTLEAEITAATAGVPTAAPAAHQADLLLRQVLVYNLSSRPETRAEVEVLLHTVSAERSHFPSEVQPDVDLLLAHARLILTQRTAVDALLAQIVTLPTDQQSEALFQADQSAGTECSH